MNKDRMKALKITIRFIEELSWLFETNKNLDLKKALIELENVVNDSNAVQNLAKEYQSPNPNKHFLIGVLPKLFQDIRLFPVNESIAKFAKEVLEIKVSRYEKRSKYELIGMIVCKTEELSDSKLENLVAALTQITGNDEKIQAIQKERETINFSWNETIQKLTSK